MHKKTKIYRKDYTASDYLIKTTDLEFEFFDNYVIVSAALNFYQNPIVKNPKSELFLNGENLELLEINHDNYKLAEDGLWIYEIPQTFELKSKVKIYPAKNTSLNGLYKSTGMFCTQCEAHGFQNITYYLDRPDVLSKWKVKIIADKQKYPTQLSNGNIIDGFWIDPHPKPCYLFALVVGDLSVNTDEFITKNNKKVKLEIFTEPHNIDKTDFAMQSLKNSMLWDQQRFDLEYDLDNYMIVIVDDFNMGAMENKGLNIFNSEFALASQKTATDDDYLKIEAVIGHEYFHNWTGNRVTCKDWFQLSLKEGLTVFRDQEFSSDLRNRAIKRIEDVDLLRTYQFAEDKSPLSHPVRPDNYIEMNNFYTLTVYEKGAEIVRMLHTILGEKKFQKGMQIYINNFDGLAVDIEDFVNSMANAAGINLDKFMLWYSKSGTPQINIKNIDNNITITQNDERLLPIKYGVLDKDGIQIDQGILVIDKLKNNFDFSHLPNNCVFSWLRDFSAPVHLQCENNAEFLVKFDTNLFVRFDNIQTLYKSAILENNKNIFQIIDYLLKNEKDNATLSKLLSIPSEKSIHLLVDKIDVAAIHNSREKLANAIAKKYHDYFKNKYIELKDSYEFSTSAIEKRRLKNICLDFLARNFEFELIYQQFINANCMTDKLAAFNALLFNKNQYYQQAIADFYSEFATDEQVLNKWFGVQSKASISTVKSIQRLIQHPKFEWKNPNRLRSVIGSFTTNLINFHNADGYKLVADYVIKLNNINPQIAAIIVQNLTNFKNYKDKYAMLQKQQLERIFNEKNLSNDIFEIVEKALQ